MYNSPIQKIIPFLLFLFLIFGCTPGQGKMSTKQTDIKKFLSSLPSKERFFLEFFFRCLIQEDSEVIPCWVENR